MPRAYAITFENVAVSAAQDLIQVTGASGKIFRPIRAWVKATDTTLPTAQMIRTRCRFLPATVTNGSGGSTPTITKLDPGDAGASITALANNTTQATTNGTALVLDEGGDHIYSGYDVTFAVRTPVGPSEAFTFELLSTVTGTVHLSGGVIVEEFGG
jgi:hypothetical protein